MSGSDDSARWWGIGDRWLVVLFLALVTVALTWPILLGLDRLYLTVPKGYYLVEEQGQLFVAHDRLGREWIDYDLFLGQLESVATELRNGELPTLARQEGTVPPSYALLGAGVTVLLPVSPVIFHNLLFVGSVFTSGLFTFLLVREIFDEREVAVLAGVLFMSSLYLFHEYMFGHANQWQVQWLPLVLYGAERVRSRGTHLDVALLGLAFALQVLSSLQYAVYLSFFLPLYLLLRTSYGEDGFRTLDVWKRFGIAGGLAAVLASPYLYAHLTSAGSRPTRSIEANLYHWNVAETVSGVVFDAGVRLQELFRLSILLLGVAALLTTTRRRQRQLIPFAVFFALGVAMAWGPVWPGAPYAFLYHVWPLVDFFRTPYRVLPFAILGSSVLSASFLLSVTARADGWSRRGAIVVAVSGIQVLLVHYLLRFRPVSP